MNQKKNLSKNQLIYKSMLTVTNKDILSIQTHIIDKLYGFSKRDSDALYIILTGLQKKRKIWFNNQKTNIINQTWKLLSNRFIDVKENLTKEELFELDNFLIRTKCFYSFVYDILLSPTLYSLREDEKFDKLNNELQSLKTIMLESVKYPLKSKFLHEIHNLTVSEKYKEYKDMVFEISFINGESVIFDSDTILNPMQFYNFCNQVLINIKLCYVDFSVTDIRNDLRFTITSFSYLSSTLNYNNHLYKEIQDEKKPFNIQELTMETHIKFVISKSDSYSQHVLLYNEFLENQKKFNKMIILSKNQIVEFDFDSFGRLLNIEYEKVDLNDLTIIEKYLTKYFFLGYQSFYHINSSLSEKKITENFKKIFTKNNQTKIQLLDVKKKIDHSSLDDNYIVDFLASHTFNLPENQRWFRDVSFKQTSNPSLFLSLDMSGSSDRYIKKYYITLFNSLWIAYIDKILKKKIKTSLNLSKGDIVQLFKPDKNCVSAEVNYNYIVHKIVNLESEQHNESKKLVILVDPNRTDVEFLININVLKLIKEVENKQEILENQKYKPSTTNSQFLYNPTLNKTIRITKPGIQDDGVSSYKTPSIEPIQVTNSSNTTEIKQNEKTEVEEEIKNIISKKRRIRFIQKDKSNSSKFKTSFSF